MARTRTGVPWDWNGDTTLSARHRQRETPFVAFAEADAARAGDQRLQEVAILPGATRSAIERIHCGKKVVTVRNCRNPESPPVAADALDEPRVTEPVIRIAREEHHRE